MRDSAAVLLMLASLSAAPTISPSSISEWSESALSLFSLLLVLLQPTLLTRGSCVTRQGFGRSFKVSVESGGSSSSSLLSGSFFIPLGTSASSSISDAGEPVGSKGSYFSPSSCSTSIFISLSPPVG